MSEKQKSFSKPLIRFYKPGDENEIIDFLNLSYGGWGDIQQWKWKYAEYPTFEKDNIFIVEIDNNIVGHRGLFFRDIIFSTGKICTASLGDTAVHPNYRGYGIYTTIHNATIQVAKSKNACIIFTGNARGGITYKHNKKTGFIGIKRPIYIKMLNPEKIFQTQFKSRIKKNKKLMKLVDDLKKHLYIGMGNSIFSIMELFDDYSQRLNKSKSKERVEILFSEDTFPLLIKLKNTGKVGKGFYLLWLVLSGKLKIKFTSLRILFKFIWRGVRFFA